MQLSRNAALLAGLVFALSACNDRASSAPDAAAPGAPQAAASAPRCDYPLVEKDVIDTPAAKASVLAIETGDRASDSWVRASFALVDHDLRLTDAQTRDALDRLYGRLASSCRQNPLERGIVFLYPAGAVAGKSAAWIARLTKTAHGADLETRPVLLKDDRTDRYACLPGKEPGKDLGLGTRLPPERSRHVIGTWADPDSGLTMSFERAGGKVFQVYRSAYCSSNDRGEPVRQGPVNRFNVIDSRNGDYFEVLPSGDLGVFDRDGLIDLMPVHRNLYPATQPGRPAKP